MSNINLEKIYLIIALIFGFLFAMIIPPFQSPDEDSHFIKSYLISEGEFYPEYKNDVVGNYVPDYISNYITDHENIRSNLDIKYTYKDVYSDQLLSYNYDAKSFRAYSTSTINPVGHIVPGVGVVLSKTISALDKDGDIGVAVKLQFARIACVIVYSIMSYYAIKLTPKFKKSFFAILLLPSIIIFKSAVTYDSLIIASFALALAKMLQLTYDDNKKFELKDAILISILGFILLNIKLVYSIVFVFMFFIPKEKFGNLKNKIIYFILMILAVLLVTFITKIPTLNFNISDELKNQQFSFIFDHPLRYVEILKNNIIKDFKTQMYWMLGTYGSLDTYMPVLVVFLSQLYLMFSILMDSFCEKVKINPFLKISYVILTILCICAIYTSMYTMWTPHITGVIAGDSITGVQGRYFLPLLFLLPLILNNKLIYCKSKIFGKIRKIFQNIEKNEVLIISFTSITLLIVDLIFIFIRFYV